MRRETVLRLKLRRLRARRVLPAMLPVVCLPLALVVVIGSQDRSGPHTRLLDSWVDSRGAGHLKFDVQGVTKGAVLTARLTLHRPADGSTAGVRITADGGAWSTYIGWNPSTATLLASATSPTSRTSSNGESDTVTVDVSDAIRQSGLIDFLLSNPSFATPPNVVLSADAGDDAPTLNVEEASDNPSAAGTDGALGASASPTPSATATGVPTAGDLATPPASSPASPFPTTDTGNAAGGSPGWTGTNDPTDPPLPLDLNPPPAILTPGPPDPSDPGTSCSISSLLLPSCGIWWGVGTNPLGQESWDQALTDFAATAGESPNLLHYYHVGAGTFPTQLEIDRSRQDGKIRVLLENWKPELGRSWAEVAAGDPAVDAEIDHEASYLQANYTTPFFLAIHHEPENEVIPTDGSGYTAADYAAMYRHVVQRLRADGVTNAVFVMDYMGAPKWGEASWWNELYPGDDVVDWIAEDPYSIGSGGWRDDFAGMVDRGDGSRWSGFYTWATTTHPGKPLMLAEWGVTEDPANPVAKATFFTTMVSELPSFPAVKALVYWNAPGADPSSGTRIDSDPAALAAFRLVAQNPLFQVTMP